MLDLSAKKLFLQWVRYAVPIAFVASVAGLVMISAMLTATAARVERVVPELVPEVDVQVLETSWKDALGATHTVKTTRQDGESLSDWSARHQLAVDALQAIYPPV